MGSSPQAQVQLDPSTFMPLGTASPTPPPRTFRPSVPSDAGGSPAAADYSHVQLDPNTFSPIGESGARTQGSTKQAEPDTGVAAALKRNTVGVITGLYHALTDPATDAEKVQLKQKVDEERAWQLRHGYDPKEVPDSLWQNPSRATLALHRILDAPAKELNEKADKEEEVAAELLKNHKYWRGGNLYLSGLTDRGLAAIPLAGPAINAIAERAERGDISGATTDVASMLALEHAPKIARATGKAAGRIAEGTKNILSPEEINPSELKEPPRPVSAHTKVELPLDDATIRKSFNKDLSQEARDTLREKVGDKIPAGSSVENTLMKAVAPINKTIEEQGLALNKTLQTAGEMETNSATEVATALEKLKKPFDLEAEKPIREAIDSELAKAREAMLSKNPVEVNDYIRELDKGIRDYRAPEGRIETTGDARDAAKVTIRRALRDKLSSEIPATKPINDVLARNLELRGALRNKFGDVAYDSVAADAQHMSELQKGQAHMAWEQRVTELKSEYAKAVERANLIKGALKLAGLPAAGVLGGEVLKHLIP